MTLDKPKKPHSLQADLSSVFDWMPACALVADSKGNILEANQKTIDFFRAKCKTEFLQRIQNFRDILVNQQTTLFSHLTLNNNSTRKDLLIKRCDRTITGIRLVACPFPNNDTLFLMQFHELPPHDLHQILNLSHTFRLESQKLKPYLNKPGKDLFDQLSFNKLPNPGMRSKEHKRIRNEFRNPALTTQLCRQYPNLSENDLALCCFLHLRLSIKEIAALTGKTPNSLRVAIHRILQKTNTPDKITLCCELDNILANRK